MAKAMALLRPTWMPDAVAASWSMATACMAAPRLVRCRNRVSVTMATAVTAITSRSYGGMRTPPRTSGAVLTGEGTPRPEEDPIKMAAASSTAGPDGPDQHQVEVPVLQRTQHPLDEQPDRPGHRHRDRHGRRERQPCRR